MVYIPYCFVMYIPAVSIKFLKDVDIEITFLDGKVIQYDMSKMFSKYPQLKELKNDRKLFESGHLDPGGYGVIWNDELDFDAMSVYECGTIIKTVNVSINQQIGLLLAKTREEQNVTQVELSKKSHIDQGDISKIEKGLGNPTLAKIQKLFKALGKSISFTTL